MRLVKIYTSDQIVLSVFTLLIITYERYCSAIIETYRRVRVFVKGWVGGGGTLVKYFASRNP